jgi:phosphoenolpyruvate-protein kinase (PTS system EI component)
VLAVAPGTAVVLDGQAGTLEVAPGDDVVEARRAAQAAAEQRRARARARAHEPATTADGVTLEVHANAGTVRDAHAAVEQGADGIGLLRTEFLFLDREEAPSEEEQRETYAEIARALEGRPLTIRTLDAGADKPLRFIATDPEDNPFLGVRGIRLSLLHPELFAAQLRAIAAVAKDHPVRLMFPMVGTLEELRAGRAAVEAARAATGAPEFPVGAMVEVPALPLAAERFAREAAFFSVGTNDLTQYALAAERGNPGVAALGAGTPPAVLRLVDLLVAGANVHGRSVGVCGELAGDPAAAILLAGLGVSSLSAAAGRVAEVKQALRDVRLADARERARQALDAEDAAAVAALAAPLLAR